MAVLIKRKQFQNHSSANVLQSSLCCYCLYANPWLLWPSCRCCMYRLELPLLLMHTNTLSQMTGKPGIALHDRINIFACLQVRISGPWGAVRLSCLPVLLSHHHQDPSAVCCHVLTLTCVSILNKFPALAIKQPELGRALLWARAVQGRKRLTALPTTSFTSLMSSHRPRCLSPCQSANPAPLQSSHSGPWPEGKWKSFW